MGYVAVGIGAAIVLLLGLYAYYGGFHDIKIRTERTGGETVVYKKVKGDYKQTSSASNEVYDYLLDSLKIKTYKGIGIFYDNPKQVRKEELRSEVGCIVEPEDVDKLEKAGCKYEIKQLPFSQSTVVEFPYKGGLSVLVGLMKVHPELEKYAQAHHLPEQAPMVEIYDMPAKRIIYRK